MPLRLDEIKEVQEIAMIAAKTYSMAAFKVAVEDIHGKLSAIEKRLAAIEKQSNSPTKQGKEKSNA